MGFNIFKPGFKILMHLLLCKGVGTKLLHLYAHPALK